MADQKNNGNGHYPNGNGNGNGKYRNGHTPSFIFETTERSLKHSNNNDDVVDLKKLLFSFWRNKWILAAFLIAGVAGAVLYLQFSTPIYKSEGSILISSSQNVGGGGDSELSEIISQTYGVGMGSNIDNELDILRSRMLAERMAGSLMEQRSALTDIWLPVIWEDVDDDSILAGERLIAARIKENISFSQNNKTSDLVTVTYESPSPEEAAFIVNLAMDTYSSLSTQQNRESAESAVTFLDEEQERIEKQLRETEQQLRSFMNRSGIVQVDAQGTKMIDQLATVESELQKTKVNLEVVESGIKNYKNRIDQIRPGLSKQFSDAISPKIANYQQKLAELETERMLLISNNPGIRERENQPARLTKIDREIDLLRGEISTLTEQLFTEDDRFLGFLGQQNNNNNQVSEISELYNRLMELETQKTQDAARRLILLEERNKINNRFQTLPDNMIDLARLQRDVKINEELFLTVSKQNAEMSLWKQTQFGLGRMIDSGYVPLLPVKPNNILVLLNGFLMGGILGAGFILGKENLSNRISSIEQLKSRRQPLLSSIPIFDTGERKHLPAFKIGSGKVPDELYTVINGTSLEAESLRRLKNNIIYLNPDVRPKSIVVTSPEKGDGKTTVAANLAVVYAEAGYKTLVVDTDFRRPRLHKLFGHKRASGLSDFLFGDLEITDLLKDTDITNLKLITAGMETPHPEALTESRAFRELLIRLENAMDVVILDTPPFGIISDATALLSRADATLLVAKFGKTNTAALDQTLESLQRVHANVIGTVLNGFDHKKESGYYYNSGYYKSVYENYTSYVK